MEKVIEKSNELGPKINTVATKSSRHRKKQKFNAIRMQIEFYFGDSNLSKDRFLKKLIDNDPYVPLETFLSFNRMKALTSSVKEIATSIEKSNFLELSEDKTRVRRITEIKQKSDIDDYIIYVECLPSTADHDWIRNTFSVFGNIAYISLPRYKRTKKIKEFAFIEFELKSSVEKAIAAFKEFRGVITTEKSPEELYSIVTYNKEEEEEKVLFNHEKIENKIDIEEKKCVEPKDSELDSPPPKRQKIECIESENNKTQKLDEKNTENVKSDDEETDEQDDIIENENDDVKQKSRRKRIRKKKGDIKKGGTSPSDTPQITDLRITSKQTWKRLRNQYLNFQREKIKQIKQSIKADRPKTENLKTSHKSLKPTRNINFYGALTDKKEDEDEEMLSKKHKTNEILNKKPLFSYQPGVIVKMNFNEPCVEVKCFKNEMKQYPQIKYIDIKEGSTEAFLRFDSQTTAENFAKDYSSADHICSIISGQEEKMYWDKIKQDREDKLLKKIKLKPKEKFAEKILKKSIHIRFDADE